MIYLKKKMKDSVDFFSRNKNLLFAVLAPQADAEIHDPKLFQKPQHLHSLLENLLIKSLKRVSGQ